jgi:hypothetical protein
MWFALIIAMTVRPVSDSTILDAAARSLELEAQVEHLVLPTVVDERLLALGQGVFEHHEHRLVADRRTRSTGSATRVEGHVVPSRLPPG